MKVVQTLLLTSLTLSLSGVAYCDSKPTDKRPVGPTIGINNTIGLAHRWSFNGNMKDSVGTSDASLRGSAKICETHVRTTGGAHESSYVDIIGDLLPSDRSPFTLEIWAKPCSVQKWSRIFQVHFSPGQRCDRRGYCDFAWAWTIDNRPISKFQNLTSPVDVEPGFKINKKHHIVLVGCYNNETSGYEFRGTVFVENSDDPIMSFVQSVDASRRDWNTMHCLSLGKSAWRQDDDADAEYDEIRIWNRAFTLEDIKKSDEAGPDALPKLDKFEMPEYAATSEPKPTWFGNEKVFCNAYAEWKYNHADAATKGRYSKRMGGLSNYRRDMIAEAKKLWKSYSQRRSKK